MRTVMREVLCSNLVTDLSGLRRQNQSAVYFFHVVVLELGCQDACTCCSFIHQAVALMNHSKTSGREQEYIGFCGHIGVCGFDKYGAFASGIPITLLYGENGCSHHTKRFMRYVLILVLLYRNAFALF